MVLADFGADVVRVDRAETPFGPPRDTLCRRKRSIVINLKDTASREAFMRLVKAADVLIDPYRPGVMERLGLGPSFLCAQNPRLIYARLHGFRTDGLYGHRAGHDINYLAISGVLSLFGRKGDAPAPPANILGDFAGGGLTCATGILLALLHREKSGNGQTVESNMVDGTSYLATFARHHHGRQNWDRPRGENLLDGAAPFYEIYSTRDDRFVAVGAQEPQFYSQLLKGLGLDPALLLRQWDTEHWPTMKQVFSVAFKKKTLDQWRQIFDQADACVTPVLEMHETERPHNPLVTLSASPSLSVDDETDYPQLAKGDGCLEVVEEWLGEKARSAANIEHDTKVLTFRLRTHL
jgi:alpha-methylacyl-CoA racemase